MKYKKFCLGFTLAETLITLGIIGIVAAMTLPSLIGAWKDKQFKTAYKKAYSDFSQAFQEALLNEEFTRTQEYSEDATIEEFNILKNKFKATLVCENRAIEKCWKKGDTVCGGSCASGNPDAGIDMDNGAPYQTSRCFVDISGRSWCMYSKSENIFLVDTNGFSGPNQFGKDRWIFTINDKNNNRPFNHINYIKVAPFKQKDIIRQDEFCKRPPCYYQSWLLN